MSLVVPEVTSALFKATVVPSILSPLSEKIPISIPLDFASVANLKVISGTYTPSNDAKSIITGLDATTTPSFMIIICDGQLNINVNSHLSQIIVDLAVVKFSFLSFALDTINYIVGVDLQGATSAKSPMAQGVPVNYTIIYGQAAIT